MKKTAIEELGEVIAQINGGIEDCGDNPDNFVLVKPLKAIAERLIAIHAGLLESESPIDSASATGTKNAEYKDFKLFNKYKIQHADGTPVKGKAYFVLRLDSDKPEERARVSAAMNAYLGKDGNKAIEVLNRVHDWLGVVIRDGKCGYLCSVCLGASDLADDVWEVLHPEASNQKALPDDQAGRDAVPDAPTVTDAIPDAASDAPAEVYSVPCKCPETGGECKIKEQEAPAAKEEPNPADKLEDRVLYIIADQLVIDKDRVNLDSDVVNDLLADSLDCVEIVMALEEEFGMAIPEADAEKLRTPRQVVEYFRAKGY